MEDRERHSPSKNLEEIKNKRRIAADRVRHLLQELEVAEREFAAATEELTRALDAAGRAAA
jgi:hypothetical protein